MSSFGRRTFLECSALGGVMLLGGAAPLGVVAETLKTDSPIIETISGKIRGYAAHGINIFKGIPYGAPTAGEGLFATIQTAALDWRA